MMLPVEVVQVARKPDVFVRGLTPEKGRKLAQIGRRGKQPVRMRRAIVVMASGQHQPVPLIAKLAMVARSSRLCIGGALRYHHPVGLDADLGGQA
ncbi:hypothetical protein ACW9HC_32310 [Nocardia gipuzkoensis]